MGIIEISVALIALAFTVLVTYLIITLSSVRKTLDQVNQSMVYMKEQVNQLNTEATELIRNTNQITQDVKDKVQSVNSVFQSVQDLGAATQQITASIKQVSTTISQRVHQTVSESQHKTDKVADVLRYATLGLKFWQDWQARKEKKSHKQEYTADPSKQKE